jgi:FKBP-type peptidyl-prolyl cis-trans isomerase
VLQTPRGAVYCVSQRAEHIWEGVSSATTRSRPIINTRDEPHADAERYRRLHVIVGDSNMSETTTLLKVGSADLVLRMIEAGVVMRDLTLENPIRAIREVSHDITGRRKVRLANGREASALEIQQEYLRRPSRVRRAPRRRPDRRAGRSSCGAGCSRDREPATSDLVDREIDWVIKYQLIERYRAKHDLPLSTRGSPSSTWPTTTSTAAAACTTCWRSAAGRPGHHDLEIFEAKSSAAADHPGPLRGEFIRRAQERAATSPSTGCTSSSTTRRSARCCARTRSARTTSGWKGQVLPGWDQGLVGRNVGSRLELSVPPAYAYGKQGQPQAGIKGTDTLVFVIDLKGSFNAKSSAKGKKVAQSNIDLPKVSDNTDGKAPSITVPKKDAPKKLVSEYVIEGDGDEAKATDSLLVQYKGVLWDGGKEFDSTYKRGELAQFSLQQVVKGWSQGLTGKKAGSRVLIVVPPALGYGKKAQKGIPANSTLVFTVDILAVL